MPAIRRPAQPVEAAETALAVEIQAAMAAVTAAAGEMAEVTVEETVAAMAAATVVGTPVAAEMVAREGGNGDRLSSVWVATRWLDGRGKLARYCRHRAELLRTLHPHAAAIRDIKPASVRGQYQHAEEMMGLPTAREFRALLMRHLACPSSTHPKR
jgi:hypothetical protein